MTCPYCLSSMSRVPREVNGRATFLCESARLFSGDLTTGGTPGVTRRCGSTYVATEVAAE